MVEREKVIKGLQICSQPKSEHKSCPYYPHNTDGKDCITKLTSDALTLLKEQELRVLEYSEIEKHPLVWLEDNDKEDVIPALFLQYNGWNAEFTVQAPDKYVDSIIRSAKIIAVERVYGVTWRAWMAKPTNEQRKAVKWNG